MDQPYRERRAALESLDLRGPGWQTTAASPGEGLAMVRACRQLGLEGVVAKRLDSRYLCNRRSRSWVKVKQFRRATLPVIGWVPWRDGRCGALAAGRPVHESGSGLEGQFAGIVEVGFSEADRIELGRLLARGEPVYVLVRRGSQKKLDALRARHGATDRQIVGVTGDLARPRLGLTDADVRKLKGKVAHFFHLAAIYDLEASADDQQAANVDGTRHAMECAAALNVALTMPLRTQRARMRLMRNLVQEFNVYRWAGRMLLDAARMRRRRGLLTRAPHTAKWTRASDSYSAPAASREISR
jgi:hypothetical protein